MIKTIEVMKAVRVPVAPSTIRGVLRGAERVEALRGLLARPDLALTVRISGDRELRRLNRVFLADDHATDVLSFPSGEKGPYLGDIIISWPAAQRQGAEFGHGAQVELALLGVHGLLHLLGFDHVDAREENEMNRLTVMVLAHSEVRLSGRRLATEGA